GCEFGEACRRLGIGNESAPMAATAHRVNGGVRYGTPEAAIEALARRLGHVEGQWTYAHADGREVFRVVRFRTGDGRKEYRPVHPTQQGWSIGDPPCDRLPLYGLPELAGAADVVVVEGEKCVEAARSLGYVATTSAHGAGSAGRS